MKNPDPWYVADGLTLEEFILGMLELGAPLETSIVGVFDDSGRGSRRDIDLPLHQDGVYSQKLAEAQGGTHVDFAGIDVVGLYCIREGEGECVTLVGESEVTLSKGQALVLDNARVLHGRWGPVGERILLRVWVKRRGQSQ